MLRRLLFIALGVVGGIVGILFLLAMFTLVFGRQTSASTLPAPGGRTDAAASPQDAPSKRGITFIC
jgi:hypothetical protein